MSGEMSAGGARRAERASLAGDITGYVRRNVGAARTRRRGGSNATARLERDGAAARTRRRGGSNATARLERDGAARTRRRGGSNATARLERDGAAARTRRRGSNATARRLERDGAARTRRRGGSNATARRLERDGAARTRRRGSNATARRVGAVATRGLGSGYAPCGAMLGRSAMRSTWTGMPTKRHMPLRGSTARGPEAASRLTLAPPRRRAACQPLCFSWP